MNLLCDGLRKYYALRASYGQVEGRMKCVTHGSLLNQIFAGCVELDQTIRVELNFQSCLADELKVKYVVGDDV